MTQNPATEDPNLEAGADAPEQAATAEAGLAAQFAKLQAERDDLKDKLLRTLAEMENLRRRTEREIADAKTYAVTSFARDMLGSSDNLRRALESLPADAMKTADAAVKALHEGVELTERELLKTLERHGVRRIDPQGEKFDPNLHQAMFEAPDASIAKGLVSKVVQIGYKIGERVLRPALVGVSAGAPKTPDAPAGEPTQH
ncbi:MULTISPECIES: nucleotide exchange factor GrpE [Bosea]|uniref:nucleotide exchange factor GrpE n=1 Tax=Bosea TaxID=85413 RepID=UPI00214FF192|nr:MULTISPECIES: nucleotide exchange factor GrpE [Bosea]MCR4524270.1 nucleotide exchange factor GrpE [Bosea sp. 47.2.35]MDR6826380.1 molecular chaperone GrpE [Bosea robiniae]MDR6893090.1 molecular chaperone GrpE [Bosea sp. BE109]MDR7137211.1 molecular chaperone GrpE [Bosea sp. BE168]MDR7173911.1 molecular chaperone GrpE [Bosea sp. BE271]